jgi:predicted Zn finger-like uncharacterized protein
MLIVCPSCATSYDVELTSLSADGRQVRCSRCRTVWRAEPSRADKLLLAAEALAPGTGDELDVAGEAISHSADEFADVEADAFPSMAASHENPSLPPDFGQRNPAAADVFEREDYSADVPAPPIVPVDLDEGRSYLDDDRDDPYRPAHAVEDIESVAARRQRRTGRGLSLRWPLSLLQTGMLALALFDTILIGWRSDVVRALPQTASFYALLRLPVNLRNLTFGDVTTTMEQHEGVPILVVDGNITNSARKPEDLPRLKFVVRNAARQEIYAWTAVPSRASLGPGETVDFRSRLASPPASAHDLVVRFLNRRDVVAGNR